MSCEVHYGCLLVLHHLGYTAPSHTSHKPSSVRLSVTRQQPQQSRQISVATGMFRVRNSKIMAIACANIASGCLLLYSLQKYVDNTYLIRPLISEWSRPAKHGSTNGRNGRGAESGPASALLESRGNLRFVKFFFGLAATRKNSSLLLGWQWRRTGEIRCEIPLSSLPLLKKLL